jgi:Calcineurin-like phosphoesterase
MPRERWTLVQRRPVNQQGRDFIIGDLHGCQATLKTILESSRFDPERDRLISVGDIVDRGPDSIQCLELMDEPWFLMVLGNHEHEFIFQVDRLSALAGRIGLDEALRYLTGLCEQDGSLKAWGFEWFFRHIALTGKAGLDELQPYAEKMARLPLVLVFDSGATRWQVTHAQLALPGTGRTPDALLDALDRKYSGKPLSKMAVEEWQFLNTLTLALLYGNEPFWRSFVHCRDSAEAFEFRKQAGAANLMAQLPDYIRRHDPYSPGESRDSITFCGHTPISATDRVMNLIYLDTGAFYEALSLTRSSTAQGSTM